MRSFNLLFLTLAALAALLILGIRHFARPIPQAQTAMVTIIEGETVREIDKLLASEGVIEAGSLPLELEGYLFPDSYEFFVPHNTAAVVARIQENFKRQVEPLIPKDRDLKEIITVASIIEKEASNSYDRKLVSGIIWKRLKGGIPLQVDASICYIKAEDNCLPITADDLKIKSPYNTYLYKGLPPGPISNPGLDAIYAALHPQNSEYWYYLSNPKTKRIVFAVDLEEHNKNIIKYLR